ncbi:MAG: hypothetical protein DA330_05265 [Nitrososphaera sp.]|nr:hypothetical protein [Nitrososphaera sp.]
MKARLPAAIVTALSIIAMPVLAYANHDDWQHDFATQDCDFSSTGRSDYFILEPGAQLVLEQRDGRDKVQLAVTVLDETKIVDGIETRVVEEKESENGEIVEISRNYFAICSQTKDVFYFGETVDFYQDGEVANHEGSWLAGLDGAKAGIIMPGRPEIGMKYYQEVAPEIAEDRAEIISLDEVVVTPAGRFEKVLKVQEENPLEGRETEYKFHVKGIGLIQDEDLKLVQYTIPEEGKTVAKDSQMQKRQHMVARENGMQIHQRHMNDSPSSIGQYAPGLDYTVSAEGMDDEVTLSMDVAVWKSNGQILFLDVVGGTVSIGDQQYEIKLGYTIYSMQNNALRTNALVVAENGDVYVLKLRGVTESDLPLQGSVGVDFGKTSSLNGRTIELSGTIQS